MSRKLLAITLVLFSFSALARIRSASHPEQRVNGGTVSGTVSAVNGNLISIADGAITIDATNAKIVAARGRETTVADIKPGMQLFAALGSSNPSTQSALPAVMVTVTSAADVAMNSAVQSVDSANRTFTLLNETISVDDQTSFGGYKRDAGTTFADLQPNVIVHVEADNVNGRLVAREVLLVAPAPPQVGRVRGTVKTIGTDSWTIENEKKETVTLVVNAQTKIVGSPKVGDTVEVLYNVDSSHSFVAVSIIRYERIEPPSVVQFRGTVKSIAGGTWVVTADGADKTFSVTDRTKVTPGIVVGDFVSVMATQNSDGTLTAIMVMELRF